MVDDAVAASAQDAAHGVQGLLRVEPDLVGGWVGGWVVEGTRVVCLHLPTHPPIHPPTPVRITLGRCPALEGGRGLGRW